MDSALPAPSLKFKLARTGRYVLQALFPEVCLNCHKQIVDRDFFCAACAPRENAALVYEGALKALFGAAKFSARWRARRYFRAKAARELKGWIKEDVVFLALPSRSKFLHQILKANIPEKQLITNAFMFDKLQLAKSANKLLGEAERYKRIHESLRWQSPAIAAAKQYVLCDDVSTTGATLNHAAYLLQKNLGIAKDQITLWAFLQRPRYFSE